MAGSVGGAQPEPPAEANHAIVQKTAPVSAGKLWDEAIEKFRKDNNVDLRKFLDKDWKFEKAGEGSEKAKEMFENARHLEVDKKYNLIKSIGGCVEWMGSASDFISDNASGTYGTPVKLIFGGISYFIKAAIAVKNDFDLIEETFESIHDALEEFSLLGITIRERNIFTDRLINVFISFFKFCWFSTRLLKDNSRKQQFRATLPFKTLNAIEAARKDMNEKLDDMPQRLVQAIQNGKPKPSDFNQFVWKEKYNKLGKIKEIFKKHGFNLEGISSMENRMNTFKSQFVPDTFSWLGKNEEYQAWLKVKGEVIPLIHVSGSPGAGKSFFTYSCYLKVLDTKASNHAKPTPGKTDSQLSHNVLASVIVQIAEQDAKFRDLASKELEKQLGEMLRATTTGNNELTNYLWMQMIVRGFDRASAETPRLVYILLDGIELMDSEMLNLLQCLNCDKTGVQVMVTHTPNYQIIPTVDLDNRETEALADDLGKVIDFRISNSTNMKGFSESSLGKIKDNLIHKYQEIKKEAMLSVDIVLSLMEQHGDEFAAINKSARPEAAGGKEHYREMMEMVISQSKRSALGMKIMKKLYAWCTYANEPLSTDQLQYILSLDKSLTSTKFNVKSEIQGKSSSILYITRKELISAHPTNPIIINKITDKEYQEYVFFKNPAIKEYLATNNGQISERSEDARVEIFLTLCGVLCNRKSDSGIISAESKILLQCVSNIFEGLVKMERLDLKEVYIETSLYNDLTCLLSADSEDSGARRMVLLIAKVNIHKDKLMRKERRWQSAMLSSRPENLVKKLVQGHIESLARAFTFQDAEVPFKLVYRALYPLGTSGPEVFYSILGLTEYHMISMMNDDKKNAESMRQGWENVKSLADQAIKEKDIQKGPLGSELNSGRCYQAYYFKANAMAKLNDVPGAIENYKAALNLGMEYAPIMVYVLDKIVQLYAQAKQYDKLFDEVYQQSPLLKYIWLWAFRRKYFANKSDPLRKAAVLTRRIENLTQLYEEAIGFWLRKEEFQIAAILKCELSYIYRRDARVTKMAENTMNSLVDEVLRNTNKMKGGILQLAFPQMVDMLYEIYSRASPDCESSTKVDIILRLEKLIDNLKRTDVIAPIKLSRGIITLATMLKSSGGNGLKAAKRQAEQAFNVCIADLEDSIASNDGAALYLLARILMFADLQEKARVAISLYFSKVDEYNENEDFMDQKDDSSRVPEQSANHTHDTAGSTKDGGYNSVPSTNIPSKKAN
ncbi:hypothetical protein DID88_000458 [Monilinia fructigena]|uniref:Uncharacterized protein n=1 Tax=Monilinia fructigena TaxID=38457 RepID=A0A395IN71_9HELO|nr:hypothetical protein DID88_000458 [Monilinia fructigena]